MFAANAQSAWALLNYRHDCLADYDGPKLVSTRMHRCTSLLRRVLLQNDSHVTFIA